MLIEHLLGVPLNIIVLCLVAGATRILIASEAPTLWTITGTLVASLFLSLMAYPLLKEEEYSTGLITLLVAIGSFGGKDILHGVLKLYEQVKSDPLSLVRDYLNWRSSSRKGKDGDS